MWISSIEEVCLLSLIVVIVKAQNPCSPPTLDNAELISPEKEQYNTDDVLYYKCKAGYHFKGSSVKHKTRCDQNGHFQPLPLQCYDACENRCENNAFCHQGQCICDANHIGPNCELRICKLPTIQHGTVQQVNPLDVYDKPGWVRVGAQIAFSCNVGYSIKKGSFSHICRTDGWDYITLPVCQPDICIYRDISHASAKPYRGVYGVGQTVTLSCYQGYEISNGNHQLSCQTGGVWSGEWPRCQPKRCRSIHLRNGMIDPPNARLSNGEYGVGTKLSLHCTNGYYFRGMSSKIQCKQPPKVEWSSEPGRCILLTEYNDECQTEGKVMKVDGNGDASCVYDKAIPTTKKSSLKKTEKPLTIVTSTAGGLLLLLLLVIAIVACQRRRIARLQRERSGGRHRLNTDDDRLSFVYYSNDVHVVLPSYDEAMQARRINNPPPYAPDEVELGVAAAENAIVRPTGTASVSGGSGGSTPANIYETIDEIRTTVNAVHASLASGSTQPAPSSENGQDQPALSNENIESIPATATTTRRSLPVEPIGEEDFPTPPTRYGIYDGPSEEPIYASVQRILSHSLVLRAGNNNQAEVIEATPEENEDSPPLPYIYDDTNTPQTGFGEDDISASSLSFDEEVDGDTEPLL